MTHWTTISGQVCLSHTQDHQRWGVGPFLYYLLSVMVLCIGEAVLGIFPREEIAQDWFCNGPGLLQWCHMPPAMDLGIRKAVLGKFPQEENAQDWSCDGPGHLLWCHMSSVMVLGIRKAVLGIFP